RRSASRDAADARRRPRGSPVTAAAAVGAIGPCRAQLLAELQAAAVQIRAGAGRGVDADYALGAYGALAWICGHHEDQP
ncbi:hypothetical protein, partial [Kitasatospora sp. NPDC047058]|uniref:hypothetical protein n=1 Tax=Kitasatospora sp. NPDC047058 TaxID=3155620 RepID=UPI0034027B6D